MTAGEASTGLRLNASDEEMLTQPLRWRKPRRIFVGSMTDLFGEFVPDAWLDRIFAIMAVASWHTFQVVTKRAARMRDYVSSARVRAPGINELRFSFCRDDPGPLTWPLPNVWKGVSAEDQPTANERIAELVATPAARRFVSAEPQLGPIDLEQAQCTCPWPADAQATRHLLDCPADRRPHRKWSIDLVIVGGESGPHARPMHPAWTWRMRDDCAAAGVAFFFKQWGEWAPVCAIGETDRYYRPAPIRHPEAHRRCRVDHLIMHANGRTLRGHESYGSEAYAAGSGAMLMMRVGKRRAGRLLDGREHNAMPEVARA